MSNTGTLHLGKGMTQWNMTTLFVGGSVVISTAEMSEMCSVVDYMTAVCVCMRACVCACVRAMYACTFCTQ